MGGIPGQQASSVWYGTPCLLDEWGPLSEYRDTLKTVGVLEEDFCRLEVNAQGSRLLAAVAGVAWPLVST